ncbi:MAG: hypothetical protein LBT15_05175 [Synergistaceae bacterium]|jgi:hypothetical protein|nr:hypothetical protein [Synergistaceae bacterium]
MNGKDKNEKGKLDTKAIMEKAKTPTGKFIIGIVVLLIILFNVVWTQTSNRITSEVQAVKADLSAFDTRLLEVEKGTTIDLDALKADAESIRQATDNFEAKLNAVVKAEEARLEALTREVETQKTYIDTLKSLLSGETGK